MMRKAVFLDRDGVVNDNSVSYYVFRDSDFVFNQDIISVLRMLKEWGYMIFIISNQGGISKGLYSIEETDRLHKSMREKLENEGVKIDEIYYCPHHDQVENCLCRKPESLMIEKLIARFNISKRDSFMIGDSERDVLAGNKAGVRSFLVKSNKSILDVCKRIYEGKN